MGKRSATGSLFDDVPIAHAVDPSTSAVAAEAITASGARDRHAARVLALVKEFPGLTAIELVWRQVVSADMLEEYQVRRRLSDLLAKGMVEQGPAKTCSVNGTRMVTWRAVG